MGILKKGIGLGKTIKNAARFREILTVFAKHGFDEFIVNSKLDIGIPNFVIPKSRRELNSELDDCDKWQSIGIRLRKSFEELGPSFIKIGQLLASREDILPSQLVQELKRLQNNVEAIDIETAKSLIVANIGKSFDDVFSSIDMEPIGVASIGIVYKAKLVAGDDVVIKIRRPNIKKSIKNDFEILSFLAVQIEKVSDEFKFLGVSRAINDFFKSIDQELNFLIEANNNEKFSKNIKKIDKDGIFKIPKVYRELSTEKMLVMEYLDGKPFSQVHKGEELELVQEKLLKGVSLFMHTMLADGFFHADLHGGNFFLLKDNQIGLIDFGLVGTLSKKNRMNLVAILYALVTSDFEKLVYEFLDVAEYEVIPDHETLTRDFRDALIPFIGMSVQDTDATLLTHSIVTTLAKHQIYLPREWFIIFRSMMTLDGVGKSLGIDLNLFEVIEKDLKDIMGEFVSKEALIEDAVWVGRDALQSLRILPRHIRWILKEFAKKKYAIDINVLGVKDEINLLTRSVYFMGLVILASTFFVSGALMVKDLNISSYRDMPILLIFCWGLSLVTVIKAFFLFRVK